MIDPVLPNIRSDIPPDLGPVSELSAEASALAAAADTVAAAFNALKQNGLFTDLAVALANSLTRETAVLWAVDAAKVVMDKLPPTEADAVAAAEQVLAAPPDLQPDLAQQLADVAAKTGMQGPGGWAAQAGAWAFDAAAAAGDAPVPPYPAAVEAAVKLAAALTKNDWPLAPSTASPEVSAELGGVPTLTAPAADSAPSAAAPASPAGDDESPEAALNQLLKPIVELGLKIAAGAFSAT